MLRVFIPVAVLWIAAVLLLLAVDPHHVAAHWFTFAWVSALAVGLPVAWRWLEAYKATASIAARIDAAEGRIWARIALHLEGAKSALLMIVASAFATAKDWVDQTAHTLFGLAPADLDPFKDSTLLHTFFSTDVVAKVIAAIAFLAAVLSIKGKLQAAKLVPADLAEAPPPGPAKSA